MTLVFTQIVVILLYVAVGWGAGRAGLISPDQRKYLSGLCSNLILPFTIFSAASQTIDRAGLMSMLMAMGFILLIFSATTLAALAFCRMKRMDKGMRAAVTGLTTYSNCTFLGLPLCRALFGEVGVLYNASAMAAYNLLFFTVQYSLFTGGGVDLRNLATPSMVSTLGLVLMLILGLHFPQPVQTVCSGVGSMITPLSLIIIGVMLSESSLRVVFSQRRAYLVALVRNLAVPLLAMLLLRFVPISSEARLCTLVYIACPCATLTSIYAIRCDMAPEFTAHTTLLSTLLFAATLPVIIYLGQYGLM